MQPMRVGAFKPAGSLDTERYAIVQSGNADDAEIQSQPRKHFMKIKLPQPAVKLIKKPPPMRNVLTANEADLSLLFPRDRFIRLEAPLLKTADREINAASGIMVPRHYHQTLQKTTVTMTDCRIYMETMSRIRSGKKATGSKSNAGTQYLGQRGTLDYGFHAYASDVCKSQLNPGYIKDAYMHPSSRVAYAIGRLTSATHHNLAHAEEEVAESEVSESSGANPMGPYFIIGFCIVIDSKKPQKAKRDELEPYMDEDLFPGKRAADLKMAYVHSLCSSFGIGRHLLAAVEAKLRADGYDGIMLESVAKAYSFYVRQGYVLHDVYDSATYAFRIKKDVQTGQTRVVPYPLFLTDHNSKANTFFMLKSFRSESNMSRRNLEPQRGTSATKRKHDADDDSNSRTPGGKKNTLYRHNH